MLNRERGSETVVHDNEQTNLNSQRIAFCGYLFSLLLWSFILPAPVFFTLCSIAIIGCIAMTVFPELGELLGKTGDLVSDIGSELIHGREERARQSVLRTQAVRIDHSLIQRRLNGAHHSSQNRVVEDDNPNPNLHTILWHEPLLITLDAVHPSRSAAAFQKVEKSRQQYC